MNSLQIVFVYLLYYDSNTIPTSAANLELLKILHPFTGF